MTKEAIITEAKKLPRHEQIEIAEALFAEDDYELTEEGKAMLDARWRRMREHPETTVSYEEFKARLFARAKK